MPPEILKLILTTVVVVAGVGSFMGGLALVIAKWWIHRVESSLSRMHILASEISTVKVQVAVDRIQFKEMQEKLDVHMVTVADHLGAIRARLDGLERRREELHEHPDRH